MWQDNFKEKRRECDRLDIGLYPYFIANHTNISPTNIFDIGSYDGADAERLRAWFEIDHKNVYCFEPNNDNFSNLVKTYPKFNHFKFGISNFTGVKNFLCHNGTGDISSLNKIINKDRGEYRDESVYFYRMDEFIKDHDITHIDICKIDVEGQTYETLEGFGDKLHICKSLQIEAELSLLYEGEKLFDDICQFLTSNNYVMLDFSKVPLSENQCDSLWIDRKYLKLIN